MIDLIAMEWLKLRTGRPMRYALGALFVFTVMALGVALFFVVTWDGLPADRREASSLGSLTRLIGWIASLTMAVFGALAFATEHASGMLHLTALAVPDRPRVLAAKAVVVGLVSGLGAALALILTLIGSAAIVGDRPIHGQVALGPDGLAGVLAEALSVAMFGSIGLALGTLTRSAVASVVALVVGWYVAPIVALRAPAPLDAWLTSLLPGALGQQLIGSSGGSVFGTALPPLAAFGVMAVYAVVPLLVAATVLARRDV